MLQANKVDAYYGQSQILRNVSLVVPPGEVVCLMGRNGAGKTTFMKSVMGLVKSKKGEIALGDTSLTKKTTGQRARSGISYVPQGRGIFPYLTVYENLLMGFESAKPNRPNNDTIAEMYAQFPVLETMKGRIAGTLSGGQQQQLAIARALVSKPKLLLLDEPTEGIQPSIVFEIEQLIVQLSREKNISILVVEQFLDFARSVADHFYIMETGQIVEQGEIAHFTDEIAKKYLSV